MSPASRISSTFSALKASNRMAFMPFITAGDPNLSTTARVIRGLANAGADLIEIGFPYSDPIADGPVIQASYTRALGKQVKLKQIFATLTEVSREVTCPLVGMVSYAIIFRYGTEEFVRQAQASGLSGLIVPDLPGDEAAAFAELMTRAQLDWIQLIAPTTPVDRAARILQQATGFVYCIAVAGTTGARQELAPHLAEMLKSLRSQTSLPLAVGFGISGPDQVAQLRGMAEGVIVGSALVKKLESLPDDAAAADAQLAEVFQFARSLATAAHSG